MMFDIEAHRPYIEFMRELRLERKAFEYGDVWTFAKRVSTGPWVHGASGNNGADEHALWLPRLDQWLAMLEEAGFREIRLWPVDYPSPPMEWRMDTADGPDKDRWLVSRPCRTREEAAARLWCAVTGRAVTP